MSRKVHPTMRVAHQKTPRWFRLLLGMLLLTVFAGLGLALLSLPDHAMGLRVEV